MPTGEQTQGAAWARALLRWAGWRIQFSGLPVRKGVIIAYPHTSNWDFIVGILFKWGTGVQLHFWAKEGLFRGLSRYTLGPLMRRWGAIEVDRGAAHGMIQATIAYMKACDYFWLVIAPEGTRKYQAQMKSGFYRVAVGAQVPLGLGFIDFGSKSVGISEFIMLTGDEAADLKRIETYYRGVQGARPRQAAPFVFKPAAAAPAASGLAADAHPHQR